MPGPFLAPARPYYCSTCEACAASRSFAAGLPADYLLFYPKIGFLVRMDHADSLHKPLNEVRVTFLAANSSILGELF